MIFEMDAKATFECGQCFRWERLQEGCYIGVVGKWLIKATQKSEMCEIAIINEISDKTVDSALDEALIDELESYFDLKTDYHLMQRELSEKDEHLKFATDHYAGLRLLNQAPFETLISFIISANNNIPKIKMAIEALSECFGKPIGEYSGKRYYSFPNVEDLAGASLEQLKVKGIGYRNLAVLKTCQQIVNEAICLETLKTESFSGAFHSLKQFYGVGDKVASCVLLFGLGHRNAFPIDTWVKRLLRELYHVDDNAKAYTGFVENYFTEHAGYAQQLLFYYIREK